MLNEFTMMLDIFTSRVWYCNLTNCGYSVCSHLCIHLWSCDVSTNNISVFLMILSVQLIMIYHGPFCRFY